MCPGCAARDREKQMNSMAAMSFSDDVLKMKID
jgi:hypothetical protein